MSLSKSEFHYQTFGKASLASYYSDISVASEKQSYLIEIMSCSFLEE